ncbi:MAG: hypothetical protein C0501_07725 [Isosphaera sp.]|nr:hypothetical protein [Isosphaera sp.]
MKEARPAARVEAFVTWVPFRDHVFAGLDGCRLVCDGDKLGYETGDRVVGAAARKALADADPDAVFAYFGNPDSAGHGYGFHPRSPKYTNAIEAVDAHVGPLLDAVRGRKTFPAEDWLVVVCTDHGGKGRGHAPGDDEPEIRTGFLILHGPSVQKGPIPGKTFNVDVAATALAHLGVPARAEWKLDGRVVGLRR